MLKIPDQQKKRHSFLKIEQNDKKESQFNFKPSSNQSLNIYEKYKTNLEKLNIIS